MEKDTKIDRGKKERVKSIALKANKESSDDETSTSGSDDREYAISVRNFKKFFRRKGKFVRQPRKKEVNPTKEERKERVIGNALDMVCLRSCLELDEWIKDNGCSKYMAVNKSLFSTYKAYNRDYPIWEVIQNGNGPISITTDTQGQIKILPPRTTEEILARERERKARTTLLMALPEDHLAKFHKMTDAKKMWDAIKSRFGGNDESKKMQKYILKQQFEGPSRVDISAFDVSGIIIVRVFEIRGKKGSTASSSSTQNVAFVFENTSSTNDVSTAYGVSNPSGHNSQYEQTSSYSLLANQSSCPQLDHEDLEQLDEFDLEEMDLKWQVAMISMRMKKFYKKTGHFARECRIKGNQDNRRRDAWNSGNKDGRRSGKQEDSKALVTIDGEGVDWTSHSEEEEDYALMACNSSGSDTEVTSCSKECKESYAKLKKLYDAQREQLSDASIEIQAYTQGLKKVEAQLVAHQQGQLWYEEKIRFMKIDLDDKTDVLTYHKKLLAEAQKEKEDLKAKVEKWHNSSKNLGKLLNTQMSANDKFGLGYGDHRYDGILSYENEVLQSVFMNKESELVNQPLYDRFVTAGGMHAVPPPMTGNYMPSGPDIEIDYSQFTYGPKQSQTSEFETQTSDFDTCESDCSVETHEPLPEPTVNEPKVVCQPKVWSDAPIIEEYESDSEDEHVSLPTEEQETPSFANQQVKPPREAVKNQFTHSKNPTVDKKGLGYGFTTKACFVCGSLCHLIRDCDFHEKRMAKQAELNNRMSKKSSQREIRMNHQNQFVPKAVLTRTGKIPVNTARTSGKRKLLLSPQQVVIGDPKDITRTKSPNTMVDQVLEIVSLSNIYLADQDKMALGHMTGNKAYLAEYQDFNGGPVAFGGSKCYITGKGMCDKKIQKGKQHKASCKAKSVSSISQPLQLLHMDLFGPTSVRSLNHKTYCLVITDDFSRVLVTKPQNKTPYELIIDKIPIISYIRPFGCHVTISNTIDHLGKFDGKSDEGFLVWYSLESKALRVYNLETKRVEENLHITFLENKPNVAGKGPTWLFNLDYLTDSMNYQPVRSENQANKHAGPQEANQNAGTEDNIDAGDSEIEVESAQDYFVLPIWSSYTSTVKSSKETNVGEEPTKHPDFQQVNKEDQDLLLQARAAKASSTNIVNTASTPASTASPYGGLSFTDLTNTNQDDSEIPALEEIYDNPTDGIFTNLSYNDEGAVADFTNLEPVVNVSPIPTSRINYIHPSTLILGDPQSAVQTRSKVTKSSRAHAFVYRNKKDERGVVVRNKARLVAQGHRQEERIDYDEVFAHVARIEAIRIFLAFASYMGCIVYQMDVKSAILYGKIDEEVYVSQPPGVIDPKYPKKVSKVVKALYGLHQAPRAWYATLSTFLLKNGYRRGTIDKTLFIKKDKHDIILVQVYVDDIIFGSTKKSWCDEFEALMKSRFQMSSMGELTFFLGLQVKQKEDGIFISQDKYVAEILKKFDFVSVKTASTPIETQKPLVKDEEASDVDVHLYRSMIGSLMYLTASRPDIMFAVCACSRFQVTPKTSHLSVVKRIFRYLKGKPKLGLWYPRVSSFDLEAYSDSDYAGANLDRKSTTGEYVDAANCCGQVLWIQNQMLDYGFNFMNTKIYIYNESTICIVKNPVFHSKTKHIVIRHHFIRDAYEKKLIQVLKIHTDDNVADLLTKAFDVSRESLGRALDGTEALLLPKLFILWLAKVSTDSAKLIPLGKDSTAIETLKKIPPRIIDFLARSSIHNALTVSHVVSTTFVEQFWMSAKSKIINNVRYITATVAGKPVSISEASIRSDLLFDDADGIDSLPNQAIFDAIQLMGYEGDLTVLTFNKALFSPHTMNNCLSSKSTSWDQIPTNIATTSEGSAQDEGRTSSVVLEEKESTQKGVSTEVEVSTVKPDEGTDKSKVSTDKPEVSTAKPKEVEVSTDKLDEAQKKRLNQKGVEIKDAEDSDRPRATSTRSVLTLKPLPKIDPKDKGKKVLEEEAESDAESEGVDEAERKNERQIKGTKKRKSGHVKMIARKRPRPQPDDDSDDEHRKCLRIDCI
ncbi:putative ribonuclease H-like domain-containing protein [Tanacetum coccineum]|uniref:Ribonuclease H-like domain-containing protein n=1 Tax=Tanacetum coccineum TaxID=301880 RepID=A0ABQ5I338_9ASTR